MEKKSSLESHLMKILAYYLAFGSKKEGLEITPQGFILLEDILEKDIFKLKGVSQSQVQAAVDSDQKSYYEIQNKLNKSNSIPFIRLRQSPSINIDEIDKNAVKIQNQTQIPTCIYGTFKDLLDPLKKEGLHALPQKCFEFVTKNEDFRNREDKFESRYDTFIEIDVEKAMKDGIEFFLAKNGLVYSKGSNGEISSQYFKKASILVKGKVIQVSLEEREKKKDTKNKEESKEEQKEDEVTCQMATIDPNPNLRGTHFKYLCILDFEAQCTEGEKLKIQEIIEFPVVVVDVETKKIIETFHYYVKPTEYPKLFPFCTQLTGVTQDKVDNGEVLPSVLEKLNTFLEEKEILKSSFCFVSCGDWDLSICLRCETRAKKIPVKGYLKRWINIKKTYPMPPGCAESRRGMVGLLKFSGLQLEGRHHSGIDDSMNIARIVLYLLEKKFKFTTSMVSYVHY